MPIYEYECTKHGRFEVLHRFGSNGACPDCGEKAQRVMSTYSFTFAPYGAMSPAARKLYDVSKPAIHREV